MSASLADQPVVIGSKRHHDERSHPPETMVVAMDKQQQQNTTTTTIVDDESAKQDTVRTDTDDALIQVDATKKDSLAVCLVDEDIVAEPELVVAQEHSSLFFR